MVYIHHSFFIHPPVAPVSQVSAIVGNAALNITLTVISLPSVIFPKVGLLDRMVVLFLLLLLFLIYFY